MFKVDLHTHSVASPDGSITVPQYERLLRTGAIDYIAVTDHNRIDFALALQQQLGERIIVGEEVMTTGGEIIGLFLTKLIAPHLSPLETAKAIKDQGGVVYIPHPFETVRSGLQVTDLDAIAEYADVVEVHNGRAVFQNKGPEAATWAKLHRTARAASSDAHGFKGIGYTYTEVSEQLTHSNFLDVLGSGHVFFAHPPYQTLLYPKINRLRRMLRGSR